MPKVTYIEHSGKIHEVEVSKELSVKREKSRGLDPVKNKTVKDYEKKTRKAHPNKNK